MSQSRASDNSAQKNDCHRSSRKKRKQDEHTSLAPRQMFFNVVPYIPSPPPTTPGGSSLYTPPPGTFPAEYNKAIAQIEQLVDYLTPPMRASLIATLSVVQIHLSTPSTPHRFACAISSPTTTELDIKNMADIIDYGLRAFVAKSGSKKSVQATSEDGGEDEDNNNLERTSNSVSAKSTTNRSAKVRSKCSIRDRGSCAISRLPDGEVCHIIPYSVRDKRAVQFWSFISLFHGPEETGRLKEVVLGPSPHSTDHLRNVFMLSSQAHKYFDDSRITIVPRLDESTQFPYDSDRIFEYEAVVEMPFGKKGTHMHIWRYDEDEQDMVEVKRLEHGDTLKFTTLDPSNLPLPHPLLFQLHVILSRIIAMRAAAGFPVLPQDDDDADTLFHEELCYDGTEGTMDFVGEPIAPLPMSSDHGDKVGDVSFLDHVQLKRPRDSRDSIEDDGERPRKVSVVLGEYQQRMEEKFKLARGRLGAV